MKRSRLILILAVVVAVGGLLDYFSRQNLSLTPLNLILTFEFMGAFSLIIGFFFWLLMVLADKMTVRAGKSVQKLLVDIDVPEGTSKKALPLMLDDADLAIFHALMKHGRLNRKARQIRYKGKPIYAIHNQTFVIGGVRISPHLLHVVRVDQFL